MQTPRQNPAMSNATLGPVAAVGINPADTFGSLSASSLNLSNASIEFSTGALAAAIPLWWNTPAASFQAYRHDIAVPQSNLSGNKYALLIGINYFNCRYSQSNNINSASAMKGFLMSRFGYPEDNITLLTDDPTVGSKAKSTRLNILRSIETMMEKIQANDSVFLYFSGFSHLPHSLAKTKSDVLSKIRSIRADYILPSDFEQKGAIESRSLYNRLVKKLPASARLIAVFDCRISDTALDVPYKYSVKGEPMYTNALSRNNLYETGANMCSASNASVGDLSHRFRDELIAQERQRQSSADGRAEDLDRIRQCTGDIVIFGWDYDYSHQENRKLPHVSGNLMSTSWSSAVDRKLRSSSRVTFQDILRYVKASSKDADKHLKPFVASGRKISIDDELVI
ncbi:Ca(2+)-dependent cysteine protease [Dipsacomyces acuminosporus]|nr:Ca(2+)-dependent cysteine protease [Dipsacomyces acuminosporus]